MRLPQGLFRLRSICVGAITLILLLPTSGWSATSSGTSQKHGAFSASQPSVDFGTVALGTTVSQTETLTNISSNTLTIYSASTTGAGFSSSGLTPPVSLTPGQSYTFMLTFAPQTSGLSSGTFTVGSKNLKSTFLVPLAGTGAASGQLSLSPSSQNFGNVTVGASSSLGGTVTASGATVVFSSSSINNPEFTLSGLTFPVTLQAGTSASFNVSFTPGASGSASGTLSFASNATNSAVQSLSGSGVSPTQHSVNLTWDPSTSVVSGYNVYRGTQSGGPYSKINAGLDGSTAYTDGTVQSGLSYFYVTTAVDSSGTESSYSNEVAAVIPTP